MGQEEKAEIATSKTTARRKRTKVHIEVTRINIDDPTMQHGKNFARMVLPRLRNFVEAVYEIRKNDAKRYQLLIALSLANTPSSCAGTLGRNNGNDFDCDDDDDDHGTRTAWKILHGECPWLF